MHKRLYKYNVTWVHIFICMYYRLKAAKTKSVVCDSKRMRMRVCKKQNSLGDSLLFWGGGVHESVYECVRDRPVPLTVLCFSAVRMRVEMSCFVATFTVIKSDTLIVPFSPCMRTSVCFRRSHILHVLAGFSSKCVHTVTQTRKEPPPPPQCLGTHIQCYCCVTKFLKRHGGRIGTL